MELTRRGFGIGSVGAALLAQEKTREITSASVPGDPDAPSVSEGTVPAELPFASEIDFTRRDVPHKIEPFPMASIRLLPGVAYDAQTANETFLSAQSPDRLLHVFRVNAGLKSTATPLGGWERPDCEVRGHFVGHYLSACALSYSSTGNQELKSRGDYLVAELAKCQQQLKGGYLSAFPTEYFDRLAARQKVWAPFYTVHKIMAGLLDMHQHCNNAEALNVLTGMADWADHWSNALSEPQMQMALDTEFGGIAETLYSMTALTGRRPLCPHRRPLRQKAFLQPARFTPRRAARPACEHSHSASDCGRAPL